MESGTQGLGQCAGVAGIEIDKISPRLEGFVGMAHDELETDFDVICASEAGVLFPLMLISINAVIFLFVVFAVLQWKPRPTESTMLGENFTESFISSLRYARHSQHMKVILL
jgi:hypothetical protein